MGDLLNTPTIKACSVVLIAFIMLAITLDALFKSKAHRWIESEKHYYYIIYSALLIICILIAMPFWGKLVYLCDRDSPYKKTIQTCSGGIELIFNTLTVHGNVTLQDGKSFGENKSIGVKDLHNHMGLIVKTKENKSEIIFLKENEIIFKMISNESLLEPNGIDKAIYTANFKLNELDKSFGRPLDGLKMVESMQIYVDVFPELNEILGGVIKCTFNGSIVIEIPIQPQIIKKNLLIIHDIQKYLMKEN